MDNTGYNYFEDTSLDEHHSFLLPKIFELLEGLKYNLNNKRNIFELGCGNGSVANVLTNQGWDVTGVDPSIKSIKLANEGFPNLKLYNGSADDNLTGKYKQFPIVLSLEVIEHVFDPHKFSKAAFDLIEPGGTLILSTPYHGYIKNLLLAITGRMDEHYLPLWKNGHIKFWSENTLNKLLVETGFKDISFYRLGRIPVIAKSMLVKAIKPIK
jgi:2-polyprenyl-3-methyl-5-hydroxy-6-metoxy-1,4-benzoquinol methylase